MIINNEEYVEVIVHDSNGEVVAKIHDNPPRHVRKGYSIMYLTKENYSVNLLGKDAKASQDIVFLE